MHNDKKPGIRITVERISVTTIRTRTKKVYCEICLRSLGAAGAQAGTGLHEIIRPPATAIENEDEEGEIE